MVGLVLITIIFVFFLIVGGIDAVLQSKECKVWGGQYSIATGCLMKYDDKLLTLEQYKKITAAEITQPIPHNINITGGKQ